MRRSNATLFRRMADATDTMMRAAMPRVGAADPKPALPYRIPARPVPATFRLGALTFKLAEVVNA